MFGEQRKRLNLHHQDQSWDRERADTEMRQDAPGMSAARQASKSSSCSSGESGSSDSGGSCNTCPLSCLQANGGSQSATAELAVASKIPRIGKALRASKCNKVRPAPYHNKHRPERVKDRELSRSTQGGASKPTQSQDILKNKNEMKHLFRKTNIPRIIEFGHPLSAEPRDYFLGGATPVPHLSTIDILSSESEEEEEEEEEEDEEEEEEEEGDGLSASCWDTYRERDLISFPRTVSHSAHNRYCLQSFKSRSGFSTIPDRVPFCSLTHIHSPLPELTSEDLPPNTVNGGSVTFSQQPQKLQSCCRTSQTNLASSHRTDYLRQSSVVSGEEDAVQSRNSTTDTLQSSNECCNPSTSRQLDDLNVDDEADSQDCQAALEGATAARKSLSLKDSNKETICRLNQRLSNEEIQCRICYCGKSSPRNPLLSPCLCSGSLQFIHFRCLKRWIKAKIQSGSGLNVVKRCEICKEALTLDLDTFDLNDYCRRHRKEHQANQTEWFNLREVSNLLAFRSFLSAALLPELLTPSSPVPRISPWSILPFQISMRLRRTREWRAPHLTLDPQPTPFF